MAIELSLIHISEPTRQEANSYAVFCLKKKNTNSEKGSGGMVEVGPNN